MIDLLVLSLRESEGNRLDDNLERIDEPAILAELSQGFNSPKVYYVFQKMILYCSWCVMRFHGYVWF